MMYRSLAGDLWDVLIYRERHDLPNTYDILIDTKSAGRGTMDLTAVRACGDGGDKGCVIFEKGEPNETNKPRG